MFNGKMKALTFSYDDGVLQDERLIELFKKYGMKATFNLNSGLLGKVGKLTHPNFGKTVDHSCFTTDKVKRIYDGFEVAVHTHTHPLLPSLSEEDIVFQVEKDRELLSELVGYDVLGMAYPCGGVNNDDRVAEIIKRRTPIKYSRTITSCYSFEKQENLLRFNPTIYHMEWDKMFELAEDFLRANPKTPMLYYGWGHSYELDFVDGYWEKFEDLLKLLAFKDDIFYGTNMQTLIGK